MIETENATRGTANGLSENRRTSAQVSAGCGVKAQRIRQSLDGDRWRPESFRPAPSVADPDTEQPSPAGRVCIARIPVHEHPIEVQ